MKLNLKKILIATALVCGASLAVGSVNSTFANTRETLSETQVPEAQISNAKETLSETQISKTQETVSETQVPDAQISETQETVSEAQVPDAQISKALVSDPQIIKTAQKWYEQSRLVTPDGKKTGDRVIGTAREMDNGGYYTENNFVIQKAVDFEIPGSRIQKSKESVLKDKQTIDVEVKGKDGQVIAEKKGVNVNVETKKSTNDKEFKIESFEIKLDGLNNESEKKVDVIVKDPTTNNVLATNEYQLPPIDTNCPKFVGTDGHTYACDRLVINYDGEEGNKYWLFAVPVPDLQNSFLKNYKKDLTVKFRNKNTNKEIELKTRGNDSQDHKRYYLEFDIKGSELADGVYDVELFDGTTKLGGFSDVELNSATASAGN